MKPRHHIAAAVIIAVCIAAALDARQPSAAATRAEASDSVPRKYWLVTPVTLDTAGRVSTAGTPEILDSHAAYQLADMLAVEEAREAAGVATPNVARGNAGRVRCAAEAVSTGEQCRKYARPGSAYCEIHDPNRQK